MRSPPRGTQGCLGQVFTLLWPQFPHLYCKRGGGWDVGSGADARVVPVGTQSTKQVSGGGHRRDTGVPTQLATGRGNPRVSGPRPQAAASESPTVRSQRDRSDLASALWPPVPSVPTRAYLVAAAAAAEMGAPGASKLPWRVRPAAGRPGANRSGPGVVETDSPVGSLRSAHTESDGAELRAPRNPACCGLQGLGWALCQGVSAPANQSRAAAPRPGGTTWDSVLWCPTCVPAPGGSSLRSWDR